MAMARLAGFEPATYGLEVRCSIQLSYKRIKPPNTKNGAGNGIRTRDLRLGRPSLYQLSYSRLLPRYWTFGRGERIRTFDPLLPKQVR
jgi:hypothetical protein